MRGTILVLSMFALLGAGCAVISPIPPQVVTADDPEPRTVKLSAMCADMGWSYETGPGAYNYTAKGPKGDLMVFTIGKDIISINNTKWRQERDTVELKGRDLLLPESTHNFVVKHFGMHHLVRNGVKAGSVDYTMDPITPETTAEVEKSATPKLATSSELRGLHICIDAGHGGKDIGGAAFGIDEKTIALAVSLMLRDLCEQSGAKVTMTRTTDVYPDLDKRVEIANTCGCQLFLSVHANIAPNSDEVNGFEAFYNGNSAAGQRFAKHLVAAFDAATEAPNRGAKKDPRGLRVLEKTKVTSVLFELGFLSNEAEGKRLAKKSVQQAMAKALWDGIVSEWSKKASISR